MAYLLNWIDSQYSRLGIKPDERATSLTTHVADLFDYDILGLHQEIQELRYKLENREGAVNNMITASDFDHVLEVISCMEAVIVELQVCNHNYLQPKILLVQLNLYQASFNRIQVLSDSLHKLKH